MANGMNSLLTAPNTVAIVLGLCSSFLDNVALVAAAMGMGKIPFGYYLKIFTPLALACSYFRHPTHCCRKVQIIITIVELKNNKSSIFIHVS